MQSGGEGRNMLMSQSCVGQMEMEATCKSTRRPTAEGWTEKVNSRGRGGEDQAITGGQREISLVYLNNCLLVENDPIYLECFNLGGGGKRAKCSFPDCISVYLSICLSVHLSRYALG